LFTDNLQAKQTKKNQNKTEKQRESIIG